MQTAMTLIRGFFRFWYDFIVGDCWQLAAGVVAVLVSSVLIVRNDLIPLSAMPFVIAAAIMLLLVLSTLIELRSKRAAG